MGGWINVDKATPIKPFLLDSNLRRNPSSHPIFTHPTEAASHVPP